MVWWMCCEHDPPPSFHVIHTSSLIDVGHGALPRGHLLLFILPNLWSSWLSPAWFLLYIPTFHLFIPCFSSHPSIYMPAGSYPFNVLTSLQVTRSVPKNHSLCSSMLPLPPPFPSFVLFPLYLSATRLKFNLPTNTNLHKTLSLQFTQQSKHTPVLALCSKAFSDLQLRRVFLDFGDLNKTGGNKHKVLGVDTRRKLIYNETATTYAHT